MIQAENPEQIPHNQTSATTTQVHGFASSANSNLENNQIVSATNNQATQQTQEIRPHKRYTFQELFFRWWYKLAVIFLTINGLIGTWKSIKFIAIDFRELEKQLELHQIQAQEVNQLVAMAIIVAGTTMISIIMAVRLNKTKETSAHNINLIFATILIIGTKYIQKALLQFNLLNIFTSLF